MNKEKFDKLKNEDYPDKSITNFCLLYCNKIDLDLPKYTEECLVIFNDRTMEFDSKNNQIILKDSNCIKYDILKIIWHRI